MRLKMFTGFLALTMAATAAEMTGWISDASCGAGNASSKAASRSCAERCLKAGAEAVFVTEKDQAVYKIANADKAKDHVKGKVKIEGTLNGQTLTITKIQDIAD